MSCTKTFQVAEFSLGHKVEGDRIVFKSVEEMEQAHREIDNGKDIYVAKDGLVSKLLHKMVSPKIYDGTLRLSAQIDKSEVGKDD
jgi:hypothetical protein